MVKVSSLDELKHYVRVISSRHPDKDQANTIKTAIYLLNELPAVRESLLDEYFTSIFHLSVKDFVLSYNGKHGHSFEDSHVEEIKHALEELVLKGPHAWVSLIIEWAISLLGGVLDIHGRASGLTSKTQYSLLTPSYPSLTPSSLSRHAHHLVKLSWSEILIQPDQDLLLQTLLHRDKRLH